VIFKTTNELVFILKGLLASPQKAERLGRAARQVASQHSWEKVADRVARAYETVVRNGAD